MPPSPNQPVVTGAAAQIPQGQTPVAVQRWVAGELALVAVRNAAARRKRQLPPPNPASPPLAPLVESGVAAGTLAAGSVVATVGAAAGSGERRPPSVPDVEVAGEILT